MPLDRGNSDDDESSEEENESGESKNSTFRKVDKETRKELDKELTEGVADMVEEVKENSSSLDDMLRINGGSDTENNSVKQNGTEQSESTEDSESTEAAADGKTIVSDQRSDFASNPFKGVSLRPGESYEADPEEFKDIDDVETFEFPDKIKVDSGYISEDSNLGEKDRMRVFIDHSNELVILMFESHRENHYVDEEMRNSHELLESDGNKKIPGVMLVVCDYRSIWQLTISSTNNRINDLPEENEADKKITNRMLAPPDYEMSEVPKQWWSNSNQRKAVANMLGSLRNQFSARGKEWRHLSSYLKWDKIDLYLNSIEDGGTPIELLQSIESVRQINVGGESEVKIDIDTFDGFHLSGTQTIEMDADDFHATTGTTDPEINAVLSNFGGGTGISWGSWKLMKQFISDIVEVRSVKREEPKKVKAATVTSEIRRNASLVADEKAFTLTKENTLVSEHEGEPVALVKSPFIQEAAQSARIPITELSKELQSVGRLTDPTCEKQIDGRMYRVWPFKISALATSVDDIAGLEQSDIDEQGLVEEGVNPSGEGSGDTSGDGSGSGDTIDPYGGE